MSAFDNPDHELNADQVRSMADARAAQVIDLREQYERDQGHIPDDRYLDMHQVALETDSIGKDRPVIFYCRTGLRSGMAAAAFRSAGWDAYHLRGGLLAWVDAGQPLEPADGTVADH